MQQEHSLGALCAAKVMASLRVPRGTKRLIFKTDNTARCSPRHAACSPTGKAHSARVLHRGRMHQTPFDSSYTAMTSDGARWALANLPDLQLLGIDYTSIATYEDLVGTHVPLLSQEIVIVEGLVLDEVPSGALQLICLPPPYVGSDGGPIRCVTQI